VWPLDPYDIYTVNRDGTHLKRITFNDAYTAEGVLSPDGKRIVFTSLKDGDLEIYTMNTDGSDVRRLTNTPGYDGGAWWSPDGKQIVYRANHPTDSAELRKYRELLVQRLVRPAKVELWLMNADGSNQRQITNRRFQDHFLVELQGAAQRKLRSLSHQPRRYRAGAAHFRSDVRRISGVQPGRQEAGLGVESRGKEPARDQRLHRGLDQLAGSRSASYSLDMKHAFVLIALICVAGCATTNSNRPYQPGVNTTRTVSTTRTRRSGGIFSRHRGSTASRRGGSRGSGGSGKSGGSSGGRRHH
jgi:hypothetical protein